LGVRYDSTSINTKILVIEQIGLHYTELKNFELESGF
jgi:hypothetical protein